MKSVHSDSVTSGYLQGGGEMGELVRTFDWSSTKLGPPESWPVNLLTTLSIILNSRFPMFLWWGDELIQFYNDAYRPSLGNDGKHPGALGARAIDYWPEIWDVIYPLIQKVMTTGQPTWSEDQLIPIFRNGKLENVYWTFGYSSVNDASGNSCGVLVICNETTQKVEALNALTTANEECEQAKADAEEQRDRLKQFLLQAPAGICILEGSALVYGFVNEGYQQFFPGRNLLGKALLDAVPEIRDQEIHRIITNVFATGETYTGDSLLIPLAYHSGGEIADRYFNFIYQAKFDGEGNPDGVIVFAFEVTDIVIARKELEVAEDTLQLALKAGQIGTWTVVLKNMGLKVSERTAELFGFDKPDEISMEDVSNLITPEHRERIIEARKTAFRTGRDYHEEYSITPIGSSAIRWVRSMGKTYYAKNGEALYMTGTIIDISEQRLNEIRKNDFISMVSHELKTPLTSISLYLQLLASKSKLTEDPMALNTVEKVTAQLRKMETLINGFLNIARLESNKIYLDRESFRLDLLISEIIEEFSLTASGFDIRFRTEEITVSADRNKIGSVISNLLNNAVKYSGDQKVVDIDCILDNTMVRVSVADKGIGVKPSEASRLFERFYRVEAGTTRTISGFGIGLYLCSEIIALHNGRIWIESEPGLGSVFYFELPVPLP
jgi:two-component system sensor histidine kinase VicK